MAQHDDDTPIIDENGDMVHKEDLGSDLREQLGLDNQEDNDNY